MTLNPGYMDSMIGIFTTSGIRFMEPADIPQDLEVRLTDRTWWHIFDWERFYHQWTALEQHAERNGHSIFNGKLVQFDGNYQPGQSTLWVNPGIDYQTVVCLRNIPEYREKLTSKQVKRHLKPWALAFATAIVTSDNFYVLKEKPFFGDWPPHSYEKAGGFVLLDQIGDGISVVDTMQEMVIKDYTEGEPKITPEEIEFTRIYALQTQPIIAEYHVLGVTQLKISLAELKARVNQDIQAEQNNPIGLNRLLESKRITWHEPSYYQTLTYKGWMGLVGWKGMVGQLEEVQSIHQDHRRFVPVQAC